MSCVSKNPCPCARSLLFWSCPAGLPWPFCWTCDGHVPFPNGRGPLKAAPSFELMHARPQSSRWLVRQAWLHAWLDSVAHAVVHGVLPLACMAASSPGPPRVTLSCFVTFKPCVSPLCAALCLPLWPCARASPACCNALTVPPRVCCSGPLSGSRQDRFCYAPIPLCMRTP